MASKVKRGSIIQGFVREDSKGHYITNSSEPYSDGFKKTRLQELNGCKVIIIIMEEL